MRLLIVGDPHLCDKPPVSRTDSYAQDILDKLVEIGKIAEQAKVAYIVIMGDLFHNKAASRVSHWLVQRTIEVINNWKRAVLIIPGNHDLAAGRIESISKQPLGVVGQLPQVRLLVCGYYVIPACQGWIEEDITFDVMPGSSMFMGEDVVDAVSKFKMQAKGGILLAHVPIAPPGVTYPYPFVPAECFVGGWKLIIYGHQHGEDGLYKIGDSEFINYGAISRGALTDDNINRKPKVCVVETNNQRSVPVELTSVKPSGLVFRIEEIEAKKLAAMDAKQFLESLGSTTFQCISRESVVAKINEDSQIHPDVKAIALDILENLA